MAPHKLTEGVWVAFDMAGQEVLIACFALYGFIGHRTPSPPSTNVSR
ncbi:hypothetical protein ACH4S8_23400 [Streptomyces sp. NPDC021080]